MDIVKYTGPMYKFLKRIKYKLFPKEMVSWWMYKDHAQAKVTEGEDGSYIMWMENEKYPFPGYPRGHLLYGVLSKFKHELKNKVFNDNWARLENGERPVLDEAREVLSMLIQERKHDMMPVERMVPSMRELYRSIPDPLWRDILTFILQEDDGYRFRVQWFFQFISKEDPIGSFQHAMEMLEHAEVTGDMKERIRLIRRVLTELWKDPQYAKYWLQFVENVDLKKVCLSKADKFFFRAKFFKVDYPDNEY